MTDTRNFFQHVETPDGPVEVHVNRRGCTGPWTEADADALSNIVSAAVHLMRVAPAASPLPGATTSAVTEVLECNECGMMRSVLTGFLGEIHDCPKAGAWCLVEHRHPASGATT